MAQGKKAKAAARPKTYALHEDEDGWEGIQEAQNAAATRALFQVTATLPLPHPPYTPIFATHSCRSHPINLPDSSAGTLQACCNAVRVMVIMALVQQIDGVLQLAEGQDVYQLLGSPYQDLWLHWLDEGNEAYKQQAKNSNQERLDFVRSVVAAAAASNAVASQNGSAEPTDSAATGSTKQVPKVSVSSKQTLLVIGKGGISTTRQGFSGNVHVESM